MCCISSPSSPEVSDIKIGDIVYLDDEYICCCNRIKKYFIVLRVDDYLRRVVVKPLFNSHPSFGINFDEIK